MQLRVPSVMWICCREESEEVKITDGSVDEIVDYCQTIRHQLKAALLSPDRFEQDSPVIQALFSEVHNRMNR